MNVKTLYARGQGVIKPGLERTAALLAALDLPQNVYPAIHITGTNGKGSTAAMLETMLRAEGYITGLYTSPHLHQVNERFRLAGEPITTPDLEALIGELEDICQTQNIDATFHEFTTALAFYYFAQQNIDIAIIEACMGGRWDATNVISPAVSVITNIGLDHTKWLGPTKQHIASEKAGIIKTAVPLVTTERDTGLRQYLANVCQERHAPFHYAEVTNELRKWPLSLPGDHQYFNAAAALTTLEVLQATLPVSLDNQRTGLATTKWPGRIDIVSKEPLIIVDAAHNRDSVAALASYLDEHMAQRTVLVLGIKEDKDITPWIEYIVPTFKHIIVTEGEFMPAPAEQLATILRKHHLNVHIYTDTIAATTRAYQMLTKHDGMLVAGSLYMIPAALAYLRTKTAQ